MRLLDLFCGAGGAAMGYHRAGFDEIVGVDIKPQPHYPFTFIQADAMTFPLDGFDAIHASPPCQAYSVMRHLPWLRDREYPMLIGEIRERLVESGTPYVIENVMGAPLEAGWLCGLMFGLPIFRHRLFETSFFWLSPGHPSHRGLYVRETGTLGSRARDMVVKRKSWSLNNNMGGGHRSREAVLAARLALDVPWMKGNEHSQAIPPAYTEYIGRQLLAQLRRAE